MSRLVGEKITKIYGEKEVLRQVDLELESGKIYGMLGRNGAGKTTLLSILTGQNSMDEGRVTIDKEPVWENSKALERICFSREINPVASGGIGAMKVREYLKIAATFLPYWDREMERRLIQMFDLDVKKRIVKLSKGMMSMVTIIVAMASKAEFTFLDEPVAGLDVVAREKFYRLLLEEYMETGRTFVVSTHIIEEAAEMFEEVILVDKGRILLKENTEELLERSFHISGKEEVVERVTDGLEVHDKEKIGRSLSAAVFLRPGERIPEDEDVSIQRMSLQKIFVALCGEEER